MIDQSYLDSAHLLRRAGFGAAPDVIRAAAVAGLDSTTAALLNPPSDNLASQDDEFISRLAALAPENAKARLPMQAVKIWWMHRMLMTSNPLVEKMTLFWHGHFTSRLGGDGTDMLEQNKLLRYHALGNFRTLTLAISRNSAMLKYLNGNQNYKAHPNENYARELMELFTCGIGNYTEDDVKAAARAFTGWNIRADEFAFNPRQHDDSTKTFLGKTGNWNGNDIVDILVAHPATATRLCTQLFAFFAYPDPEPAVVDALTKTYYDSGYDIKAVMNQILRSRAFYSEKARNAVIKSPAQFVVGTIKMLGIEAAFDPQPGEITNDAGSDAGTSADTAAQNTLAFRPRLLGKGGGRMKDFKSARNPKLARLAYLPVAMRSMGQDLLAPPSVKGWDGGEAWINSTTLMNRVAFGERLAQPRQTAGLLEPLVAKYAADHGVSEAEAWVGYLAEALGPLDLTTSTRDTLVAYIRDDTGNSLTAAAPRVLPAGNTRRGPLQRARQEQARYLGLLPLILGTPDYQVC